MENKTLIKFRPHHFMCSLSFRGAGYSVDFVRNYQRIIDIITEDENTLIEVTKCMDDVCTICPNRIDDVVCKAQDKVVSLDKRHSAILGLIPGEILSWKQAKDRIKERMTIEEFDYACQGCRWKVYGVCQKSLESLRSKDASERK